jgi:hypothetical protein
MMNTQQIDASGSDFDASIRTLSAGEVVALGHSGGRLDVLDGQVWLTRSGDMDDHVLGSGATFAVPSSGGVLVEAWSVGRPARIAWHPRSLTERVVDMFRTAFSRCWDLVDPARRVGIGATAAVVALLVGGLLFGPLSDARALALAGPALLHNGTAMNDAARSNAAATRGQAGDAGPGTGERAHRAAQEARRGAAGAA